MLMRRGLRPKGRWVTRVVSLVLVVLLAATAVAGCGGGESGGSGGSDGPAKVRVAYVPVATSLPAFVAEDAGIFARHGLDVTLTPIENITTIPGSLGRQFDIGFVTSPDLIKAGGQGIRVATVTGATVDTQKNAVGEIVVTSSSSIRTVSDLRGKRVGTPSIGAAMHVATLNALALEGVDRESIEAVEMPFPTMADQLEAGRVDAVEAVQPFLGLMLEAGNRSIGSSPLLSVGEPPVLSTIWIAERGWAADNPSVVERWTRSLVEAERLIERDEPRARTILRKYTELPADVARTVKLPVFAAEMSAAELETGIEPWEQALNQAGQLSGNVSADGLVSEAAGP